MEASKYVKEKIEQEDKDIDKDISIIGMESESMNIEQAREAIIKVVEGYDRHEACKASDTDECKGLVLSGIEAAAEITCEICNQVKEEL
jgi:hypothetical protein